MAPSDELEYLKGLVSQLNDKIKLLEEKVVGKQQKSQPTEEVKGTPRPGGLRMILVGPPGAGVFFCIYFSLIIY